jgi:hypothetical protein
MPPLNEAQRRILERGFMGPRPGSNAFPLLQLGKDGSRIDGEVLDAMFRAGHFEVTPARAPSHIRGGDAGPYGEIPDVDLDFAWRLSAAGRAALSVTNGIREGEK